MNFCEKCGRRISEESVCPNCGNQIKTEIDKETSEVSEAQINSVSSQEAIKQKGINIKKLPKNILVLGGIVLLIIIILIVLICNIGGGVNLKKIYNKYCNSIWSEVASDGSYLYIDTNPYDDEDDGVAYYEAYIAIKNVNKELGLPDSVLNDMERTTSADVKQTAVFDNINVSWRYHPDKGLEVTYKKNG